MYVCAPGVDLITKAVRRECQIPWDWSNRCCELLCGCWESNPIFGRASAFKIFSTDDFA